MGAAPVAPGPLFLLLQVLTRQSTSIFERVESEGPYGRTRYALRPPLLSLLATRPPLGASERPAPQAAPTARGVRRAKSAFKIPIRGEPVRGLLRELQRGSSVTISSATAASKLMSDGSDSSSTFLSSTVCMVSGAHTTFRAISGTDGQNHQCTVSATCSDADVLQADLIVEIRDL